MSAAKKVISRVKGGTVKVYDAFGLIDCCEALLEDPSPRKAKRAVEAAKRCSKHLPAKVSAPK